MVFFPITAIFFVLAIQLALSPSKSAVAVVFFLVALGLIPTLVRHSRPRLRKALFYDDRIELRGRGLLRTAKYTQIPKIEHLKPTVTGPRVSILLTDETRALYLLGNPSNKALNTDLVTWVRQKNIMPGER